jgi:hypothetical protein
MKNEKSKIAIWTSVAAVFLLIVVYLIYGVATERAESIAREKAEQDKRNADREMWQRPSPYRLAMIAERPAWHIRECDDQNLWGKIAINARLGGATREEAEAMMPWDPKYGIDFLMAYEAPVGNTVEEKHKSYSQFTDTILRYCLEGVDRQQEKVDEFINRSKGR